MQSISFYSTIILALLLVLTSACSEQTNQNAFPVVTLDPQSQALYSRTCANCHENPATQSPQTGIAEDWQKVKQQGIEQTMQNVMNGYKGMPPAGQCFECSPEQIEQMIYFMAQASS